MTSYELLLEYAKLEEEWEASKMVPSRVVAFRMQHGIIQGMPTYVWLAKKRQAAIKSSHCNRHPQEGRT